MTNIELANYRAQLFKDATRFKKVDKIPHASHFLTWKILDAGYKLGDALSDWSIMEEIQLEHQRKYNFDCFVEVGNRNNYQTSKALGSSQYIVDSEAGSLNYVDEHYCEREELREFMADETKFKWEKGMPRKYAFMREPFDIDIFQKAIDAQQEYLAYSMRVTKRLLEEVAIPPFQGAFAFFPGGFSCLSGNLRGMKDSAIDMRRDPVLFKECIEYFDETAFKPALNFFKNFNYPANNACFDAGMITGNTMLNYKQYEAYSWPYLKATIEAIAEKGWTTRVFIEGNHEMFYDLYNDLPKHVVAFHLDQDDIFEARKRMPDHALMGGMKNILLGTGTKEECVNLTKKLIDELGNEGGFILSQNSLGSYKNDANPENLKAVCDCVNEYRP